MAESVLRKIPREVWVLGFVNLLWQSAGSAFTFVAGGAFAIAALMLLHLLGQTR